MSSTLTVRNQINAHIPLADHRSGVHVPRPGREDLPVRRLQPRNSESQDSEVRKDFTHLVVSKKRIALHLIKYVADQLYQGDLLF